MKLKVTSLRHETKNTLSILFEKPKGFAFYPGQYLDIELPIKDPLETTRIFSLSSSPSEDFLMITYNLGITPYKQQLRRLQPGDIIKSSHPAGTVVIDDSSPLVMIAGGVGIAPHRSMLKWAVDRQLDLPITLIYSSSDEIIFKKELDLWQKQLPSLTIHYIITSKNGRLNQTKLATIVEHFGNQIFYLAGPPGLVDDFENILLNLRVDSVNIRTDRFDGY